MLCLLIIVFRHSSYFSFFLYHAYFSFCSSLLSVVLIHFFHHVLSAGRDISWIYFYFLPFHDIITCEYGIKQLWMLRIIVLRTFKRSNKGRKIERTDSVISPYFLMSTCKIFDYSQIEKWPYQPIELTLGTPTNTPNNYIKENFHRTHFSLVQQIATSFANDTIKPNQEPIQNIRPVYTSLTKIERIHFVNLNC